jgi:dTMP kinase
MNKGKFITLEGGEGAGKSTVIQNIKIYLESKNIPCIITREPGGTENAEEIRSILKTRRLTPHAELFLFEAARSELITDIIQPALKKGTWVICDRFYDSTTAYQAAGREIPESIVRELNEIACKGLRPNITFLLDIEPEIGLARTRTRNQDPNDPMEQEGLDFYVTIQKKYLELANDEPDRFRVINANQEAHLVWNNIKKLLKNAIN